MSINMIYQMPDTPPLKSQFFTDLANHFLGLQKYWNEARKPLEAQWKENRAVYLCKRQLPEMDTMPYIDLSPWGSRDIFDGVNNLSYRLATATCPKDETWLTVVGRNGEAPAIVNAVQQQQVWMHRKARTRRVLKNHFQQLIIHGSSWILLRWLTEWKYRRLGTMQSRKKLRSYFRGTETDEDAIKAIGRVRVPEIAFQGPQLRVINAVDVFMDPEADVVQDRRPGTIIQTFMRPADLKAATDEDGAPMYENIDLDSESQDGIKPHTANDVYWNADDGNSRLEALNDLGVHPQLYAKYSTELIPVYVIYQHYLKFQDVEFFDTYFYVAKSKDGTARMIRVEENPSDCGHRLILQDNFIDFFASATYGLSGVEKMVSAWHQQQFLEAITLNAMAASAFPAYIGNSSVFKDEYPDFTPGAWNEITGMAMSSIDKVLSPMPVPERGMKLGIEAVEYYRRNIGSSFESAGAYGTDKSADRETATSVNFRATNQNLAVDEFSEQFSDTVQELCQWTYDMNQQTAVPEDKGRMGKGDPGYISYVGVSGNKAMPGEIQFDLWKQPRKIECLGIHGVANKQQAIQNKQEGLKSIAQTAGFLPNVAAISTKLLQDYFNDLNIETDEIDWLTPQQIAAADPQVQMMAIMQGIQNPDLLREAVLQAGGQPSGQPGQQPSQPGGQEKQPDQQPPAGTGTNNGSPSANQG